jgi:hypothetical protein
MERTLPNEEDHIVALSTLDDFDVAPGTPDVRGWQVVGSGGLYLGIVSRLLVDTETLKVCYLDIDLANDLVPEGNDRQILVPIEQIYLDRLRSQVSIPSLRALDVLAVAVAHKPLRARLEDAMRRRTAEAYIKDDLRVVRRPPRTKGNREKGDR